MSALYRVSFLTDKKRVTDILDFCSGKVSRLEVVPAKELDERPIAAILDLANRTQISIREIGERLVSSGRSAKSAYYTAKQLMEAGTLRAVPRNRGLYQVVQPNKKGAK